MHIVPWDMSYILCVTWC